MAIIRKKELKALGPDALTAKLHEIRRELNTERGLVASGGRSSNPGRIRELRRVVARILTFESQRLEMASGKKQNAVANEKTAAKPAAAGKIPAKK